MSRTEDLEARVRDALAEAASAVEISPTAWLDNQALLRRRRDRRRWSFIGASAAAVVAAVVAPVLLGGGQGAAPPAGERIPEPSVSHGDRLLPKEVEVARVQLEQGAATVELSIKRYERSSFEDLCIDSMTARRGDYRCVEGSPFSYNPEVAVDYLSISRVRNLVILAGAVDSRVTRVRAWLSDGNVVDLDLVSLGSEGLRGFGRVTEAATTALPQRLVAYGRKGYVLQGIDLPSQFDEGWLPTSRACAGDRVAEFVPNGDVFPNAYVALGTTDARISARLSRSDSAEICLKRLRGSALAGWFATGSLVVAVVAPEVENVRVTDGRGYDRQLLPEAVAGSPWQVAVVTDLPAGSLPSAEVIVMDGHGLELDRAPVSRSSSP